MVLVNKDNTGRLKFGMDSVFFFVSFFFPKHLQLSCSDAISLSADHCVMQGQVIFKLPAQYRILEPLAYVEWLKEPHNAAAIVDIDVYHASCLTRGTKRVVGVIPLSTIQCSCHLILVFGKSAPLNWHSETVLNQAITFYVNCYLHLYSYKIIY